MTITIFKVFLYSPWIGHRYIIHSYSIAIVVASQKLHAFCSNESAARMARAVSRISNPYTGDKILMLLTAIHSVSLSFCMHSGLHMRLVQYVGWQYCVVLAISAQCILQHAQHHYSQTIQHILVFTIGVGTLKYLLLTACSNVLM